MNNDCSRLVEWLSHPVTTDGSGYSLVSPAGSSMVLSDDERRRIVACLSALEEIPTGSVEEAADIKDRLLRGNRDRPWYRGQDIRQFVSYLLTDEFREACEI